MLSPFITSSLERHKAEHEQLDGGGGGGGGSSAASYTVRYNILGSIEPTTGNTFLEFNGSYLITEVYAFLGAAGTGDTVIRLMDSLEIIEELTIPSGETLSPTIEPAPMYEVNEGTRLSVNIISAAGGSLNLQLVIFYRRA